MALAQLAEVLPVSRPEDDIQYSHAQHVGRFAMLVYGVIGFIAFLILLLLIVLAEDYRRVKAKMEYNALHNAPISPLSRTSSPDDSPFSSLPSPEPSQKRP